jgi:hypothetical protein
MMFSTGPVRGTDALYALRSAMTVNTATGIAEVYTGLRSLVRAC